MMSLSGIVDMYRIFVFGLFLMIISCRKNGDRISECEINRNNIAGAYRIVSLKFDGNDITDIIYPGCQSDDIILLREDGTYEQKDNQLVCDVTNKVEGNWTISGRIFSYDQYGPDFIIQYFDCRTIQMSYIARESFVTIEMIKQ